MATSIQQTPGYSPEFLIIPQKPTSPISYTFYPAIPPANPQHLIIFINSLGLPASSWTPTVSILRSILPSLPAILTYDRFGQGLTTSRDPIDGTPGKELGHDFLDVVEDLHEIILNITASKFALLAQDICSGKLQLFLVGASIGVPIARLYVQDHPGIVAGLIFLDSNIANLNYSDFIPDPDSPAFDPKKVLDDECTIEMFREARTKLVEMFDFKVKNAEGLDRTTSPTLLPYAHAPVLVGAGGKGPELLVVGHDPEAFTEYSFETMGTPRCLTRIINRQWKEYNEVLRKITDENKWQEVCIATDCGHFIMRDDPNGVAKKIGDMLDRLGCSGMDQPQMYKECCNHGTGIT